MSKLSGYIIFISIIVLLCTLFGLTTQSSSIVSFLLNPTDYTGSVLYERLGFMIGLFVIATALSFFVSGNDKIDFSLLANVGIITWFLGLAVELLCIWNALSGGIGHMSLRLILSALLLSPLFIMYAIAVMEWWRAQG